MSTGHRPICQNTGRKGPVQEYPVWVLGPVQEYPAWVQEYPAWALALTQASSTRWSGRHRPSTF